MNDNMLKLARQLNQKIKIYATDIYSQLQQVSDNVNKLAKMIQGGNYDYVHTEDHILSMQSTCNQFLAQVYQYGATKNQIFKFILKIQHLQNQISSLMGKEVGKDDVQDNRFYYYLSNIGLFLNKIVPVNIAAQKPKTKEPESSKNNPTLNLDYPKSNIYEGKLSDVTVDESTSINSKDLLNKNKKESNLKNNKLTKKAAYNEKILAAIQKVLHKFEDMDYDPIEWLVQDLPDSAKQKLIKRLISIKGSEDGLLRSLQQANEAWKFFNELEEAMRSYRFSVNSDEQDRLDQESALGDENLSIVDEEGLTALDEEMEEEDFYH